MMKSPYATTLTKTGKIDPINHKPYRTKAQKVVAREHAAKTKGGYFVSNAPRSAR